MYDRDAYAAKLAAVGFTGVAVRSIREHVYPGYAKYEAQRDSGVPLRLATVTDADREQIAAAVLEFEHDLGISDYVVVIADAPGA